MSKRRDKIDQKGTMRDDLVAKAVYRGCSSFAYAAAINVVIYAVILAVVKDPEFVPVLPEFAKRFNSGAQAMLMQCTLVSTTSLVFGAGSVIMELKRLSLLIQSILYFVVTAGVWIPVGCICWEINKYTQSLVSMVLSYTLAYAISWYVQYRSCMKSVKEINQRLEELQK